MVTTFQERRVWAGAGKQHKKVGPPLRTSAALGCTSLISGWNLGFPWDKKDGGVCLETGKSWTEGYHTQARLPPNMFTFRECCYLGFSSGQPVKNGQSVVLLFLFLCLLCPVSRAPSLSKGPSTNGMLRLVNGPGKIKKNFFMMENFGHLQH